MKQTNNAIKFLMAQYRAIFQNAYFKGLATAAVVTMGLAAGQAQAAADITSIDDLATAGDKVIATGTDVDLTADTNSAWKANLTISSGGSSGHTLKAKADGNKVTGTGSLILQNSDASKLTIGDGSEANGLSVDISAITISQGELAIVGGKGKITSVTANNVTVGGSTKNATLTIKSTAKGDVASFGKAAAAGGVTASVTTLKEKGKIVFNAEDAATSAGAVLLGQLKSTGGTLNFTGHGTSNAWGTAEKLDITVAAQKKGVIALTNVPQTPENEGLLTIQSGTIQVAGKDQDSGGMLYIQKGDVVLGDNVVLAATTHTTKAGIVMVGDSGAGETGKLTLSKTTLDNFLKGTNLPATITTPVAGALDIGKSGTVVVNGDINLADYTFAS